MAMIAHHLQRCVERWGGQYLHYEPINRFLDSTKLYVSDWRHRVLLHNTLGVSLVEYLFPPLIYLNEERTKTVSSRTVAEMHILEDLGAVPTCKWTLDSLKPKSFKFPAGLEEHFSEKQLQLIIMLYSQAGNKARVYYSTFLLDLLVQFYGTKDYLKYIKGIKVLTDLEVIPTPGDFLRDLPIANWMGGLKPKQLKQLRKISTFI